MSTSYFGLFRFHYFGLSSSFILQKGKQNKKIMITDFNISRDRLCYRITSGKMILGKLSQELASGPFHQHS